MKTRYIYILFTFLTLSSCQDPDEFLNVVPTGIIIPSTLEDHDKMLQDYAILRSMGLNIRFMDPDVFHNQASFSTISSNSVSVNAYTWKHDIFNETQVDQDYNNYYYYIHVMNQILQDVDNAPPGSFDPKNRGSIKAQALAQRAMEYFLTVNEYAHHYNPAKLDIPGVAMPLKIDLQAQLGKSTVKKVYDQIISDLNQSLSLFPANYPAINEYANFRPGRASVYALLAEVYLYMGNFEAAKTNSNMALSMYNYLYDYKTINFASPSNPWLGYTAPASVDWYAGTLNKEIIWHRYLEWSYTNPFQLYSPELESLYDKVNDKRWTLFSTQRSRTNVSVSPNNIYMYPNSERCNGLSVPRLMLTNAEAKIRTNDGPGAIAILNTLLAKRIVNFTSLSHTNNASTLQIIKNERRKELAGSSVNLYDQKRYHVYGELVPTYTRTNPTTNEVFTLVPGSDGYVVKIAQSIRNLNPNLN
jgi:tetratricopeptide (TPR) repeat protein